MHDEKWPWQDSNLQSLVPKTNALSIRPQGHVTRLDQWHAVQAVRQCQQEKFIHPKLLDAWMPLQVLSSLGRHVVIAQPWDSWAWQDDPPRTRTWNLRLRRPTPYPLGQQANWSLFQIDMWSSNKIRRNFVARHSNFAQILNFSIPSPPGSQDLQFRGLTFCHWAIKLCHKPSFKTWSLGTWCSGITPA